MASLGLQSVSLLVLLVMLCPESSSGQEIKEHLCGSHLVDALHFVCGQNWFYSTTRRDTLPSNENGNRDPMGMTVKRNVVEQCCHNPCSLADLEMYCN